MSKKIIKNITGLDKYWMPFTANKQFRSNPRILLKAKGIYYTKSNGGKLLDATSGLWCVNAGHGRKEISRAIKKQIELIDYSPAFQMGHEKVFRLAENLSNILPKNINKIFFTNSGSEAVETSLKIVHHYYSLLGKKEKRIIVGRERSYHGVNYGGISVSGIQNNRNNFGPLITQIKHLPHTHNLEKNSFSRGQPKWGAHLADNLENMIKKFGSKRIAAVIIEPIAGSTGVHVPPLGYLQKIRKICDKYNILLIFDEVITGFGRTGNAFASNAFKVNPDIIVLAKGLTNGAVPMGAVGVKKEIYETINQYTKSPFAIEFPHGYTYSGNPVSSAAALATLNLYKKEKLFEKAKKISKFWEDAVHSLKDLPKIIDIRNFGLMAAIELDPIKEEPTKRAFEIYLKCFDNGLLIRTTGDTIALSPPLIINKKQIEKIIWILGKIIKKSN